MLFPNPTVHEVTFLAPHDIEAGEAVVVNGLGQIVARQKVDEGRSITLRTDRLAAGTYHFVFYENGGAIFTERLVILK